MTDMNIALSALAADTIIAPACQHCGGVTRLYGIEPHLAFPRTDIRTYVCTGCENVEVIHVPLPMKA